MYASSMCCLMVGTGRHHVVGREPRKATGACEAVLPLQELSGLRSLPQPHPSTSVRVTIAPSSNLAEETTNCAGLLLVRLRHRQNSATTALGVFSVQRVILKKCFRQRVQNPLMFNLKCGLIAASPARAATPAPRHSRTPAAIPRPSPQISGRPSPVRWAGGPVLRR